MANGQKNCPVRSITNPVRAGATIPERLPMQFCMPVQRPAARGPATVWVMAQRLAAQAAQLVVTPINMAMERTGGESTHAMRKTTAPTSRSGAADDPTVREPSAHRRRQSGGEIRSAGNRAHLAHGKVALAEQVEGHPGSEEVGDVIGAEEPRSEQYT